ncbi:MAG: NifB/NifX family molybdenum-iron cluster-binding protein [Candidatus Margulisiibacteriota bacterium]
MKVAISTDNGQVSAHFGRCPEFTIVEIENGRVITKEVLNNPGHQPGFLPQFLHDRGVTQIIAGGMGQRAQGMFAEKGIETIVGISGNIAEVVKSIEAGTLKGGESLCKPGAGKGYGVEKSECDHPQGGENE